MAASTCSSRAWPNGIPSKGRETVTTTEALKDTYGRLRGLKVDQDGSLLVTTDNNSNDQILRVRPAS